ncbi:hypothetical protein [Pseudomonas sp. 9Ag]|uniref:hypothetical protein n=1 Tax=Pseudomonas sp. 9Ag TaxID=2653167 RepID=UPI0012F322B1|nr:hypothetical protein [Pseudomonas sp. 9Ag]VXC43761.1 conserved membrane hypothetical protein [Pseudomonas sp. 9Ag]
MKLIFFSVLLYIYFPIILGIIANHAVKNGYVTTNPLSYILIKFKHSSYEERFLLSLSSIFLITIPIAFYSTSVATDSRNARILGITMISAAMLLSVVYAITSRPVRSTYSKYAGRLNFIIAVSATINFARATSFAEGVISELVGVRASELPTGLAWLSLIMVPVAWLVTLSIGSIAIYAVALFSTSLKDAPRKSHAVGLQVPIQRKVFRELAPGYAVAFSFAILAVSPLTVVSNILGSAWAEKKIREELVSASFHVKASKCSIDGIDGAKVAFLNDGKAIVALPHEKLGFVFQPITCVTNWMDPAQIIEIYKNGNSAS